MKSFIEFASQQLLSLYPENEVQILLSHLMQSVTGYSRAQLLLHKNSELSDENRKQLLSMLQRLQNGEPLQYVLGETEFYGLIFRVSPSVLIPRPETEELVDLIVRENKHENLSVLDIGTGSGCIAISLSHNLKNAQVEAWDISEETLAVAKTNAETNNQTVKFQKIDVLNDLISTDTFDIIVSNPPYVCTSESREMHRNVVGFEPHLALFVSDHDPLLFYRKITELSTQMLKSGGRLYFEINAAYGKETASLLTKSGFLMVEIVKDIFGKDRIVKGIHN